MLNKKIESALNAQINAEFWSAYLYLSMSVFFESQGRKGAASWFKNQFNEEQGHALKIMNYIVDRGGKVELKPIAKVDDSWKSLLHAFEDTLKHEQEVTDNIDKLYALAQKEKDYATENMLRWFIDEQVEEEATANEMIDALNLIGDSGAGLYAFDKQLGARV